MHDILNDSLLGYIRQRRAMYRAQKEWQFCTTQQNTQHNTMRHYSSIEGLQMTLWWMRFSLWHAGQQNKQSDPGLTSVIRKNLPFALEPRSKKKRLWPARTIWPPVSVSVIVGGDGPGPTTVLLPATAACIITTTASNVAPTCFALIHS